MTPPAAAAVVISCEHASNRVPARYRGLGLDAGTLESHIAWDIGARRIASTIARRLGRPLIEGRWTRLLIDLNRSVGHPNVIPRSSFGILVPANARVDAGERERRFREYWAPYRRAVARAACGAIARHGSCLHLSVHSFTPAVEGRTRTADVGILYNPARGHESRFARSWAGALRSAGVRVRRNYPYRGTADGLVTQLRHELSPSRYRGIELEVNQRLVGDRSEFLHTVEVTLQTFVATLGQAFGGRGQ